MLLWWGRPAAAQTGKFAIYRIPGPASPFRDGLALRWAALSPMGFAPRVEEAWTTLQRASTPDVRVPDGRRGSAARILSLITPYYISVDIPLPSLPAPLRLLSPSQKQSSSLRLAAARFLVSRLIEQLLSSQSLLADPRLAVAV